jgi:hypothetical protein
MNHLDRVEVDSSGNRVNSGKFFTLTFTYTFDNPNDTVYFAYCYPYTYTDLRRYIAILYYPGVLRVGTL